MIKKIKNIGKVCTSKTCEWLNKFPYCSNGCINVKTVIEYEN